MLKRDNEIKRRERKKEKKYIDKGKKNGGRKERKSERVSRVKREKAREDFAFFVQMRSFIE